MIKQYFESVRDIRTSTAPSFLFDFQHCVFVHFFSATLKRVVENKLYTAFFFSAFMTPSVGAVVENVFATPDFSGLLIRRYRQK